MLSCLHIYICPVFLSVDLHSLPLPPFSSVHSKYLLLWRNIYFFVSFKQIPFCSFFLCPFKFSASPFILNVMSFLSVSSRLFINSYIVIKFPLSLLLFSVVRCISFNLSSYVRFSNSSTILVAICNGDSVFVEYV